MHCSTHDSAVLSLHSPSLGFPRGSTDTESICNAEDPSSIPGLERFPGEEIRLPTPVFLGFSGGSEVKNLPVMRETWVQSLGWEDPLEKGIAICVCVCVCVFIYFYKKVSFRTHCLWLILWRILPDLIMHFSFCKFSKISYLLLYMKTRPLVLA